MVIISFISISCFISTVSWECGRSRCRFLGSGGGACGQEGVVAVSGVWRMLRMRRGGAGVGMGVSLGVGCLGVVMDLSFVIWNRVLN